MSTLADIIKTNSLPGSVPFLIVSVALGVALLRAGGRTARLAHAWLVVLVIMYWLLSTPFGADMLVSGLQGSVSSFGVSSFEREGNRTHINAIVLLTGGVQTYRAAAGAIESLTSASALRALEAVRVWKLLGPDAWIIVSGGIVDTDDVRPHAETIRDALIQLDVPPARILIEPASVNTHQHALNAKELLRSHGIDRFVLVTSPTHIRRSALAFRAAGLNPIPSVSQLNSNGTDWRWTRLWPTTSALSISQAAIYDCFALMYYRSRGWLTASGGTTS
jgi:uncharacterized SAM-binding protein YcdF (DUF218 family)